MDFIQKVGQIVVEAGRSIGTMTKEMVDTANLKADIHANDVAIRKAYAKLGRKYFADHSAEEDSPYAQDFKTIKELKAKKAEMEAQLNKQAAAEAEDAAEE